MNIKKNGRNNPKVVDTSSGCCHKVKTNYCLPFLFLCTLKEILNKSLCVKRQKIQYVDITGPIQSFYDYRLIDLSRFIFYHFDENNRKEKEKDKYMHTDYIIDNGIVHMTLHLIWIM